MSVEEAMRAVDEVFLFFQQRARTLAAASNELKTEGHKHEALVCMAKAVGITEAIHDFCEHKLKTGITHEKNLRTDFSNSTSLQ